MPEDEDHTSLAVLSSEVRGLREDIKELCVVVGKTLDDHEARLRTGEKGLIEVQQKLGVFSGLQIAFTALAATIAAWAGRMP
jgi:hypothetical protein